MKDILLNLLFILTVFFITQLFLDVQGRKLNRKTKAVIIYVASLVSIIFCMTFSIMLTDQFRYDLRAIPFILGGLFGGPVVTVGLYVSMLLYRLILGLDSGFWGNVINYGLITIPILLFSRRFISSGAKQRILISTIIITSHVLFSRLIYTYIFASGLPISIFIESSLIKIASSIFIVLFTEGVFQHRKLREQLGNIEKMELVSHLSASISHEVRNGLTSAHGFFQLLRERETDPKKLEYIRFALDELSRTENIVRDFLTFAKPAPRQMKNIDMDHLIENSISLIEPFANMNSIEIQKYITPFSIKGDESMIQQSFINIFKNAIEAMPNGGILEIHMAYDQKESIITIKDTGIGMTQEQMDRMGTPYYTTKGQGGTGLGMMVAYRVIQDLNGKIKVYSKVDIGTTFIIHLPRSTAIV